MFWENYKEHKISPTNCLFSSAISCFVKSSSASGKIDNFFCQSFSWQRCIENTRKHCGFFPYIPPQTAPLFEDFFLFFFFSLSTFLTFGCFFCSVFCYYFLAFSCFLFFLLFLLFKSPPPLFLLLGIFHFLSLVFSLLILLSTSPLLLPYPPSPYISPLPHPSYLYLYFLTFNRPFFFSNFFSVIHSAPSPVPSLQCHLLFFSSFLFSLLPGSCKSSVSQKGAAGLI